MAPRKPPPSNVSTVVISIGSNLGDRFANIELALRLLETPSHVLDHPATGEDAEVIVIDTSFLYETAPMYVTDQPSFINCACLISTNIPPQALLALLKKIETTVGRIPSIRNGPRAVDLDIVLYNSAKIDTRPEHERSNLENLDGHLVVPHPRMTEREFVLRPLNDIVPDFRHPTLDKTISTLLDEVMQNRPASEPAMHKAIPFPRYPLDSLHYEGSPSCHQIPGFREPVPPTSTYWTFPLFSQNHSSRRKTYIMATLNVTPDSFSDGSLHNTIPAALSYTNSSVAAGADIIDVGGISTRPGAEYVDSLTEMQRVVPVVQKIRALGSGTGSRTKTKDVLISVDTYNPDVAYNAVKSGANCINDVYAFTGPEYPLSKSSAAHLAGMQRIARDLAVPVVLMHSRGDAGSNKNYEKYNYAVDDPVLEGIRVELGEKVDAIVKGRNGLRRWFVIVDPGVGFSKTVEGNLEILRHASLITKTGHRRNPLAGHPLLIGASRKSFLAAILAEADNSGTYEGRTTEPKERGWATAAAVACAIQQEAAVVRVHDVLDMGDVVRVASALWG